MSKVTKAAAHYQSFPHQHKRCSYCTMFRAPGECTKVQGEISRHGYCRFFDPQHGAVHEALRVASRGARGANKGTT